MRAEKQRDEPGGLIELAKISMTKRRKINYSWCDIFYNVFWCCKSASWRKKKPYSLFNRYDLYERGKMRFKEEFDAQYYAQSLRNLKLLMCWLISEDYEQFTVYQRSATLPIIDSDCENQIKEDLTKSMPKLFEGRSKTVAYVQKINEFMNQYSHQSHDSKDDQMLRAIVSKKHFPKRKHFLFIFQIQKQRNSQMIMVYLTKNWCQMQKSKLRILMCQITTLLE